MDKGKRTWIEINRSALQANIASYKRVIGGKKLGVVIKSNAYGHGMLLVARLCDQNPLVDWLCVAMLCEAKALVADGITKEIQVLSYVDDTLDGVPENLILPVYDKASAKELNESAKKVGRVVRVHLKVDTGLGRLGILPDQLIDTIRYIKELQHLFLQGIFSHYAQSEVANTSYTAKQLHSFNILKEQCKKSNIAPVEWHIANSAATSSLEHGGCTVFRVGAGAYGLWPSMESKKRSQKEHPSFSLQQVMTWKTRILCLKQVKKNQPVGYGRTFYTYRDSVIAILPVGYYDGYDFRLFNKAKVIVRGSYAPVVGKISMNMMAVDVTDIPAAAVGDEVVLIGDYDYVRPADLAVSAGPLFNIREVTTKINPLIERIIV